MPVLQFRLYLNKTHANEKPGEGSHCKYIVQNSVWATQAIQGDNAICRDSFRGKNTELSKLTPYQSENPSPTLTTYRGKEEKIVEDKKGERN